MNRVTTEKIKIAGLTILPPTVGALAYLGGYEFGHSFAPHSADVFGIAYNLSTTDIERESVRQTTGHFMGGASALFIGGPTALVSYANLAINNGQQFRETLQQVKRGYNKLNDLGSKSITGRLVRSGIFLGIGGYVTQQTLKYISEGNYLNVITFGVGSIIEILAGLADIKGAIDIYSSGRKSRK